MRIADTEKETSSEEADIAWLDAGIRASGLTAEDFRDELWRLITASYGGKGLYPLIRFIAVPFQESQCVER